MAYTIDERYMARALQLAWRGCGWVNPNPMVGAVVVKDGRIIGEGWHAKFGALHAEREAFAHCAEDPRGATLYITLEPCCHWGKTPPCTEAIIENGIVRVVMGAPDPNPLVAGKGIKQLRDAGVEVTENVLLQECQAINKVFFRYIETRRPYVVAKYAMTLDGKIATKTGASKWITGSCAREHVHAQRHRFSAIMVGIGTVLADDPSLTCRLQDDPAEILWNDFCTGFSSCKAAAFLNDENAQPSGCGQAKDQQLLTTCNPIRVIVDSQLRTPLDAQVVRTAKETPTIIATVCSAAQRIDQYCACGCEVVRTQAKDGCVDLDDLLMQLGQRNIDSVYVEGGATLHASLFEADLVDEVHAYVAPKIFGGMQAPGPVGGVGVTLPSESVQCSCATPMLLGQDVLLKCEVN